MSTPAIRAALERLIELDKVIHGISGIIMDDWTDAIAAARAALAQPVGEGPSDEELASFLVDRHRERMESESAFGCPDFDGAKARAARIADARAILARWGRPAAPPAPEVVPVAVEALTRLYWWGGMSGSYGYSADVVLGVRDWIAGGMAGDLPPLPAWVADRCPPLPLPAWVADRCPPLPQAGEGEA